MILRNGLQFKPIAEKSPKILLISAIYAPPTKPSKKVPLAVVPNKHSKTSVKQI